jgi:hypothetical protein
MLISSLLLFRTTFRLPSLGIGVQCWFNQTVDHFDLSSEETFLQRYLLINSSYSPSPDISTIILFISSNDVNDPGLLSGPVFTLANETKALVAVLELRYYGSSIPRPEDRSNESLARFHTIAQTLEDIACFTDFLRSHVAGRPQVVMIGGFFAGTLGVYMRQKFPHLVDFAWASSAPLSYRIWFTAFISTADSVLGETGPACAGDAHSLLVNFEADVSHNATKVHYELNLSESSDVESLYFIFNSQIADTIQFATYDGRRNLTDLCNAIKNNSGTQDFYRWFRSVNNHPDALDPLLYNQANFLDQRSWFWTSCTEAGWFPVVENSGTFGSQHANSTYFERVCETLFGQPVVSSTDPLLIRFGGAAPDVTNVLFIKGGRDPWRGVGFKHAVNWTNQNVKVIRGGLHSSELIGPQSNESQDITDARNELTKTFREWATRDCVGNCRRGHCVLAICVCDKDFEGEWCTDRTVSEWTFSSFSTILLLVPMVMIVVTGVAAWLLFYRATPEPGLRAF